MGTHHVSRQGGSERKGEREKRRKIGISNGSGGKSAPYGEYLPASSSWRGETEPGETGL